MVSAMAGSLLRLPGIRRAREYRRRDLGPDLAAGLAVTALMIPHGMAYAELAGLPAVNGLYTTVVAVLTYAVVGPSRAMLLGPDSSLAPLIASAIALTAAGPDPAAAIAVAAMLSILAGAICVLAGLSRLGSIAELLSGPVQLGYLNGLAVVMVVSQLAKLFGFSNEHDAPVRQLVDFVDGVANGETVPGALTVGLVSLAIIVAFARLLPRLPGVLVGVVIAIATVRVFDLTDHGVSVVGEIPSGFPGPSWPRIDAGDIGVLVTASLGLAWVTLSDTTALSRSFAARVGERVDPNREIIALGVSNMSVGAFSGFPVSASTSRTTTAFMSGGRTQLVGVVSAIAVLCLLLFGGALVEDLPSSCLAAIVIAAAINLFDLDGVRWLRRARQSEFVLCVAATTAVVLLGVLNGLLVAVALSVVNFIRRVWRPHDAVLGRIDGRHGHHDVQRNPTARQVPGLVILRFDAPLFFANADHFRRRAIDVVERADRPVSRLVIAAEPITDVDTSAAHMIAELLPELADRGVELAFAGLSGPVRDRLRDYGLYDLIGADLFHETIGGALAEFVDEQDIDWVDWTEEGED